MGGTDAAKTKSDQQMAGTTKACSFVAMSKDQEIVKIVFDFTRYNMADIQVKLSFT